MKMQRVNLSQYFLMKLCIEPRSDCSLGSECFHSFEFIFNSDFYPRENWTLGQIGASVKFILGSDFILASEFILGSDFTLGLGFILGSE
jgi:hypothetical protein